MQWAVCNYAGCEASELFASPRRFLHLWEDLFLKPPPRLTSGWVPKQMVTLGKIFRLFILVIEGVVYGHGVEKE